MEKVVTIEPLRDLVLAKRYHLPAVTPGGLLVNPAWTQRNDLELWEVLEGEVIEGLHIMMSPGAEKLLTDNVGSCGYVRGDTILITPPYRGSWAGSHVLRVGMKVANLRTLLGYDVFWLDVKEVVGTVRKATVDDASSTVGDT